MQHPDKLRVRHTAAVCGPPSNFAAILTQPDQGPTVPTQTAVFICFVSTHQQNQNSVIEVEMSETSDENDVVTIKRSELEWYINRIVIAEDDINNLHKQIGSLQDVNDSLEYSNKILSGTYEERRNGEEITKLQNHNAELQQHIQDLTEKLAKETKRADGNMKMLINERQQYKEVKKTLNKKCTDTKAVTEQLDRELTALKKCKLVAIQTALEHLNKRAQVISSKTPKNTQNAKRNEFAGMFQALKTRNNRVMRDLEMVKFTSRLYQDDHKRLLRMQEANDKKYNQYKSKIGQITADCKKLLKEYNTDIPQRFLDTIGEHVRNLDQLEKINFKSEFGMEATLQDTILNGLMKERDMLEGITRMEKMNNQTVQEKTKKDYVKKDLDCIKKDLDFVNNLDVGTTYTAMFSNFPEMGDHLMDIIMVEKFMSEAIGRHIGCCGLERLGVESKTPRPVKVMLKSKQDFQDILAIKGNSNVRIQKF